jgi:LIVCS family branched-chain amino acid:cation transporter
MTLQATQEHPLEEETRPWSGVMTAGLALFAMFFGSGNLIFPLLVGKAAGEQTWYAILGLGVSAVIVPFIGLAAMVMFDGDCKRFFGRLGKIPGILVFMLIQLIIGPFGVIPRLITLMHAISKPYLFGISLPLFSLLIASVIFLLSFRRQNLIQMIGSILTPIKLLSIGALIVIGLYATSTAINPSVQSPWVSFKDGILGGYNTMDLLGALVFATIVLPQFLKGTEMKQTEEKQSLVLKKMLFSSIIAAGLLLAAYIGLALIASQHAWSLDPSYKPEEILGAMAVKILGPVGGAIAAIAVVMACLTTAIALVSCFADYFQQDICRGKINHMTSLILTLLGAMLFANLGFSFILAFLSPILQVVYPGLIVLSILNMLHVYYGFKMVKTPVFAVCGIVMAILYLF